MIFTARKKLSSIFEARLNSAALDSNKLFLMVLSIQSSKQYHEISHDRLSLILERTPNLENIGSLEEEDILYLNKIIHIATDIDLLGSQKFQATHAILKFIREIFFSILAIMSTILVFLYLLGGRSNNSIINESPAVLSLLFVVFVFIVFLLEGTQVSIMTLRLKDLETVTNVSDKAKYLHKKFSNPGDVQKYLAGRQLLTIFSIFFISRICSFDTTNIIPIVNKEYPSFMLPWFTDIFIGYGILAALVTLWFGQLIPQFLANKKPLTFLTFPIAKSIVWLSWAIEFTGITDFSTMVVKKIKKDQEIHTSARETFNSYASTYGYAQNCLNFQLKIDKEGRENLIIIEDFFVFVDGITSIIIDEVLQQGVKNKETVWVLLRDEKEEKISVIDSEGVSLNSNTVTRFKVSPQQASFRKNDVIQKRLSIQLTTETPKTRELEISRPVRYLVTSVEANKEISMGQPRVSIRDETLSEWERDRSELFYLELSHATDELNFYTLFLSYPRIDAFYKFSWNSYD